MISTKIIIIAVIIAIAIILCAYWFYHSDFLKRRISWHHQNSGETGAESMRINHAINELKKIKNKAPEDHMEIGGLIAHNLIEDTNGGTRRQLINEARENFANFLQREEVPERHDMDTVRNFADMTEDEQLQHALLNAHERTLASEKKNMEKGTTKFAKLIQRHDDNQNVHDSTVQKSMSKISNGLDGLYGDDKTDMEEILKLVRGNERAKATIQAMKKYNNKMNNHGDKREIDLLLNVYRRSKDPKNDDVMSPDGIMTYGDNIRDNLVMQLADASALNGSVTCATGRVNRVLQSLTLNDYDQRDEDTAGGTLEDYKNEIFRECNKALSVAVAGDSDTYRGINLPKSSDSIREIHAGKRTESADEPAFNEKMKRVFDSVVEQYSDKLTKNNMEAIKKDAYSAID